MERFIVRKHRPPGIVLIVVLLGIVFSLVTWLTLDIEHRAFIKGKFSGDEEVRLLWETNQALEQENNALREKVILLERASQVDDGATVKLHNEIRLLQDQVYRLKGELQFYQDTMAATADSKGLNVQGLHVERPDENGVYRFRLVLTNVAKTDKMIDVTMDMSVEGMNEAGPKTLALKEVVIGGEFDRHIKFKNFKRVEGGLAFPVGFKPLRVAVDLRKKGSRKTVVQRVFEWPASAG